MTKYLVLVALIFGFLVGFSCGAIWQTGKHEADYEKLLHDQEVVEKQKKMINDAIKVMNQINMTMSEINLGPKATLDNEAANGL